MTKREQQALKNKLTRLEARVGKKRDELRALIDEVEPLIESVRDSTDEMDSAGYHLRQAFERLDSAADTLSQYA